MSTPSIKKLDQAVVNRIAAGEVIQRPANALKELIENSLDAGSTQIQISIKDGGLKLLQIQDNGHGIRKEDMAIVCERFTTSKLSKFEDLSQIATYGFRGEALASISHVAHVTITTKTADSPCAYRASYSDGKLVPARPGQSADPKPCAGNNGTQITAEDLFYNVPTRRKALKSASEEYNRILDITTRYAVHNSGVSFTCRKVWTNVSDIQTPTGASTLDNIRLLYGSVASELLPVEKGFEEVEFKLKGYISNANYSSKRTTFLLFINHRAVDSLNIKRAIENLYSSLLPKGGHPFVYLSLEINPRNVDVNVHPTKKEVHFLYEDRVVEGIISAFQSVLENANSSRTFYTQVLLPVAEYRYVRTDSKMNQLETFGYSIQPKRSRTENDMDQANEMPLIEVTKKPRVEVRLTSLLQLRKEVKKDEIPELTSVFQNHTFIGCVDDRLALIQYEQDIFLLFYQIALSEFCNMGELKLSKPMSIKDCVLMAIEYEAAKGNLPDELQDANTIAATISEVLVSRADMLKEYFSMTISPDGFLLGLPMLIKDYVPCMDKLPLFLLRLGTEVDWESEKKCFETFSRELAIFYCADPLKDDQEKERFLYQVQHYLFPCFKTHFIATNILQSHVYPLANLTDLYKIFERC
ncbi:DNA mismatch repair protein MutL [Rhizopus microsporus var. microsporus]|uniref:DNA mismatch repair protein MutL n=2 Tax=Rhizopus microsporus TaxID=58291 RepID=A0A2G4SN24_RHIZD|nr:DNA mismatch repair protein MutL [Rhizopus microsporus ATCC 52813]ORE06950.1 DNA mismatch repair protein MutL [Rhizopus microsporus var. microsporus]PHZ10163.1 DNA mismatch repair protein MutL [Rhizopus microsporus ATCC 52813]